MAESFTGLEKLGIIDVEIAEKMRKSIGFRNIAVHNYDEIDLSLTYMIAHKHLGDFKEYIRQIVERQKI